MKIQELEVHTQAYYFQIVTKIDNLMRLLNSDHLPPGIFSLTHLQQLYVLHMQFLERQGYFPLSSNPLQSLLTAPLVVTQEDDDIYLYFIIPIHKKIHQIQITELVTDLVIVENENDAKVGVLQHPKRYLLSSKDALWAAYTETEFADNCHLSLVEGVFLCNVHKWYHFDPNHHSQCFHAQAKLQTAKIRANCQISWISKPIIKIMANPFFIKGQACLLRSCNDKNPELVIVDPAQRYHRLEVEMNCKYIGQHGTLEH